MPDSSRILTYAASRSRPDDHTVTDCKHACPCLHGGVHEFALAQLEQKLMDACESVAKRPPNARTLPERVDAVVNEGLIFS